MRTAENQPTVITFDKGMDESRGERAAPPGTLTLVKNARVRSGKMQKRAGTIALASTAAFVTRAISDTTDETRPIEHPAFIGRLGGQRIAATNAGWAFAYVGDYSRYLASFSAAQPVRKRIGIPPADPTTPLGPYMPACAVSADGYICTAAGFGPTLRITLEGPNGELLINSTETFGAAGIVTRVVAVEGSTATFYVLYQATDGTTIYRQTIRAEDDTQQISFTGSASFLTLANASSTWDATIYDRTTWFVAYQSGATTVTVAEYSNASTPVVGSTATFTSTNNLTYLSIWADTVTGRVWVGVVDDPGGTPVAQFRVYTGSVVLETGPTTILSSAAVKTVPLFGPLYARSAVAGDAFGVFAVKSTSPTRWVSRSVVVQAGSLTRGTNQGYNAIPISKPDAQQRAWCITHGDGENFQITKAVLLRFVGSEFIGVASDDPSPVVELASADMPAMGSAEHPSAAPGLAFGAVAVTTESAGGSAHFALPFVLTTRTNASSVTEPTTRVDVFEYSRYNQEPRKQFVASGRSGYVAGQPTELYGGISSGAAAGFIAHGGVELGFSQPPWIDTPTTTPSGSGLAAGTYVYYAVRQWVDDEGNRHLSEPSAPYSLTLSVQSSVELKVPYRLAGQRSNIEAPAGFEEPEILIYRTQNGGTEAQLVPIAGVDAGATSVWTFTDTVADAIIDDNEFIYTAGGVLANVLAPSCRYLAASEDRLWCGGLWDSDIIECSKVRIAGEPYNFTGDPSHQVVIPGEVSGLAYMDGQVCIFTEDAIYLVGGDGPNDQGAGGFAPPRALVRGVGCPREQSASILETEIGLIFRSELGFYVIPRGYGTPEYIGDKVHDEDDLVLSATTTTTGEFRLARFLVCGSGETKSDTVLTLDLTTGAWFRDEYTVDGSITGQGFSEIGEWPDGLALFSYGLQRTDNLSIIWAEAEGVEGDAGATGAGASTYISMYAQTAWQYGTWGPVGWGRVNSLTLVFDSVDACQLKITVETDDSADQTATWTIAASDEVFYRGIAIEKPNCTAYRMTIWDIESSGNASGVQLIALAVDAVTQGGMRPLKNDTERQ